MRYYDKVFIIWDRQDECIARLGGSGSHYNKSFAVYLTRSHIENSPRAQKLLENKKRYVIRENVFDSEM
jgi:hypothetical protein